MNSHRKPVIALVVKITGELLTHADRIIEQ